MNRQRGFTIIELVLTIALGAVVLALGAPSMRTFIVNNRTATEVNELVTALNLARSEAVARGLPVSVLPVTANDFVDGWSVGIDFNGDGDFEDGGIEQVIQVYDGLRNTTLAAAGATFQPTGEASAAQSLVMVPTECNGINQRRQINIALSGLIDLEELECL